MTIDFLSKNLFPPLSTWWFYVLLSFYNLSPGCLTSSILFFKFGCAMWHTALQFPDEGLNLRPLHWKHKVLTTEPPGKSLFLHSLFQQIRAQNLVLLSVHTGYTLVSKRSASFTQGTSEFSGIERQLRFSIMVTRCFSGDRIGFSINCPGTTE